MAEPISLGRLSLALVPVAVFLIWLASSGRTPRPSLQALGRMLVQLSLVGYVLVFLFDSELVWVGLATLTVMVSAASAIAIRTVSVKSLTCYRDIFLALALGGGGTLGVMIVGVLDLQPWYQPRVLIPLAGMTFSNGMNVISLALQRLSRDAENRAEAISSGSQGPSRSTIDEAIDVALVPITNSLMAVGVVSIPGMMTGQVLAGVSPLIAARYQIMIMCLVFASGGLSLMVFLSLQARRSAANG